MTHEQTQMALELNEFGINPDALANTLQLDFIEVLDLFLNGVLLVFCTLDEIHQFYTEAGIDDAMDFLKMEIKNKTVVYTQHKFFMWP